MTFGFDGPPVKLGHGSRSPVQPNSTSLSSTGGAGHETCGGGSHRLPELCCRHRDRCGGGDCRRPGDAQGHCSHAIGHQVFLCCRAPASAPPGLAPPGEMATPKRRPACPGGPGNWKSHRVAYARCKAGRNHAPRAPRHLLPEPANTVHGKATVLVRVAVDPSGKVIQATVELGGSPYFGKLALEAARRWQFATVESAGPRHWILRFEIMRTATQVIPLKAGRE